MSSFSIAGTLKIPSWAEEDMFRDLGPCSRQASCKARSGDTGRVVALLKLRVARGILDNDLE